MTVIHIEVLELGQLGDNFRKSVFTKIIIVCSQML